METISYDNMKKEIENGHSLEKIGPLYRCNSFKNKECKKTSCYQHNGGPCYSTTDVSYALLDQYSRPILSDVYIDLLVSGVYKKAKLDREAIVRYSNGEE